MNFICEPGQKIQAYLNVLKAGDTLDIEPGVYYESIKIACKGTSDSPIVIRGANGVILDAKNKNTTLMTLSDKASYLDISGIELRNVKGQNACGVRLKPGCKKINFNQCSIHDIAVPNEKKKDNCANAILAYGDHPTKSISNIALNFCEVYNIHSGWSEAISFYGYCREIKVHDTYVHDCSNIGLDLCGNSGDNLNKAHDYPVGATITNCTFRRCKNISYDPKSAAAIYIDGAQAVNVKGNVIYDCDCGIEIGAEVKVSSEYSTKAVVVSNNKIKDCLYGIKLGGYEPNLGWVYSTTVKANNVSATKSSIVLAKLDGCKIIGNEFNGSVSYEFDGTNRTKYTKNVTIKGG